MNLKHNQRTPKGVITWFEMGQQTLKLKQSIIGSQIKDVSKLVYVYSEVPLGIIMLFSQCDELFEFYWNGCIFPVEVQRWSRYQF